MLRQQIDDRFVVREYMCMIGALRPTRAAIFARPTMFVPPAVLLGAFAPGAQPFDTPALRRNPYIHQIFSLRCNIEYKQHGFAARALRDC
jgi:hypothetical protein